MFDEMNNFFKNLPLWNGDSERILRLPNLPKCCCGTVFSIYVDSALPRKPNLSIPHSHHHNRITQIDAFTELFSRWTFQFALVSANRRSSHSLVKFLYLEPTLHNCTNISNKMSTRRYSSMKLELRLKVEIHSTEIKITASQTSLRPK